MKSLDIFNELSDHIAIRINACRRTFHEAGWVESKVHHDYDLWLILEGSMTIETDSRGFKAGPEDAVLFYPDMSYTAYTHNSGCRFIYTHFDLEIGSRFRILEGFNLAGIIRLCGFTCEGLLFKKAYEKLESKESMSSMFLKGSFTILLAAMIHSMKDRKSEDFFIAKNTKRKSTAGRLAVLQPVLSHISRNIYRPLKIRELSKAAGMSEKYFISYFKKALGISPGNYINQVKMNRARDYLYQRKYSIKMISSLLGYSDQYTFSKAFKKYYDVPPSRFV